nr:MAG TPA: hypothetical protein [Caudoviricetes sp.]
MMNITETFKVAKGVLKVIRPSRLRFKKNDYLTQLYVRQIITKAKTINDVPNLGNLREVVQEEVDRIEKEYEERHSK